MNSFHCMMKTKGRQYWGREEKVMTIVCNFDACNERKSKHTKNKVTVGVFHCIRKRNGNYDLHDVHKK